MSKSARPWQTKHVLHRVLSKMISVQEIGYSNPKPTDRSYEVRLQTKGNCITLTSYNVTTCRKNARSAALSARRHFINEIANHIHELMVTP